MVLLHCHRQTTLVIIITIIHTTSYIAIHWTMPYSSSYRASFFATCFFGVLVQICHTQTIEKIVPVTPAPRPSPEGKHKSRGPLTKSSEDPAFGFEFTGIGEGPPPNATNSDPETIKRL
jgi:hypothetical protein